MNFTSELKTLANIFAPLSPLYLVGGAVRNSLLGIESGDFDIASSSTASQVKSALSASEFEISAEYPRTGTLLIRGKENTYEYTTFREDSYPLGSGGHTPANVKFTTDINIDATRRDFTCNALYCDILTGHIIDLVGGIEDISKGIIRTVKSGEITLAEDALRIMRLVRFSSQLGFLPSNDALICARQYASRLADISKERIHDELVLILNAPEKYNAIKIGGDKVAPSDGLRMLVDIGAMQHIIPELLDGIGMNQNQKYHTHDVFEHIMHTVDNCPPNLRLAGLFHDIAKPKMVQSTGMMYGHDKEGDTLTRVIMERLKFSNYDIEHTTKLVSMHMFNLDNSVKDSTLRKFIAINADYIEDYLSLRIADNKASRDNGDGNQVVERTREIFSKMKVYNVPMSIKEMDIRGGDLIEHGYHGQEIGDKLNELWLEQVLIGKKYTREKLLSSVRR